MGRSKAMHSWSYKSGIHNLIHKLNIIYDYIPIDSSNQTICQSLTYFDVVLAKRDSATSKYYWRKEDKYCLLDIEIDKSNNIILPNTLLL